MRIEKKVLKKAQQEYELALAMDGDELAKKSTEDPFFFSRIIMGNVPVFPETLDDEEAGDWVKLFNYVFKFAEKSGIQYGVLKAPRNALKTTLMVARCAYLIVHDRNIRILYTTNTHENAVDFSRKLQGVLSSNQLLIHAYGKFEPEKLRANEEGDAELWRQDSFTVSGRTTQAREPTFTASSVGKTKVGKHYDLLIYDDCVDQKNSLTAENLRKTIQWFTSTCSLVDQMSEYGPGGCQLDVGTTWADGDLHGYLLGDIQDEDSPSDLFEPLVLKAMENPNWDAKNKVFINPILNFPHILDKKRLETQRRGGPFHFATQYQNECITSEDATFRPEWFRFIPAYDVPPELKYYVFTDFAFGLDDSNDRTAIWVVGLDWERKAYCVDFDVGRWALNERCQRVIALAEKYDAGAIALEQVVSNEGIKATLLRMRDERKIRFRLQEIGGRSTESKTLRIVSLQPRFEGHRIFFVERDTNDMVGIQSKYLSRSVKGKLEGDIAKEFLRFPKATHDDIPDALSDIDKIDNKTKTYFFAGSSYRRAGPQVLGPSVLNGKVRFRAGVPEHGIQKAPENKQSFWQRQAARMRNQGTDR